MDTVATVTPADDDERWSGRIPWRNRPRRTAWVDVRDGHGVVDDGRTFDCRPRKPGRPGDSDLVGRKGVSAGEVLAGIPPDVVRVFMCGPRPGGNTAPQTRAWFLLADMPSGWCQGWPARGKDGKSRGHWLEKADLPVGRWSEWTRDGDGQQILLREVEVLRTAVWLPGDVSPAHARHTMAWLDWALRRTFPEIEDGHASWGSTPGWTGKALFDAVVPRGERWPVLSHDMQDLVRRHSTQHRIELRHIGVTLPRVFLLDRYFAYAADCWGVGAGVETHDYQALWEPQARGRYLVKVRIPRGWAHVGLLGVPMPRADDGWRYPCEPGETFYTWCGAAELLMAHRAGWRVGRDVWIKERILFGRPTNDGPLAAWRDRWVSAKELVERYVTAGRIPEESGRLVLKALRAGLLHTIGAFHGGPRADTFYVPMEQATTVPGLASKRPELVGDLIVWSEARRPGRSHPEWSSQVWDRSRAKATRAMLSLEPGQVLGVWGDGIYSTVDPGWPWTGKPGEFRVKGFLDGPVVAPASLPAMVTMQEGMFEV